MQFFKAHPNLKENVLFLILIAEEALLIAHLVTGSEMLLRISDALKEFLQSNKQLSEGKPTDGKPAKV